jgi:hypothetical protein
VAQLRQRVAQRRRVVEAERVGRAGAGDRLDDRGIADALDRRFDLLDAARPRMARRADAVGVEAALHLLLVAERQRLVDRHAGRPDRLADARRRDHERLPERDHAVDPHVLGDLDRLGDELRLVREARSLHVGREVIARIRGESPLALVAEPDDAGARLREAP